jgi:peptidoglycan/LPS O-acetylase OafA/YrhL
MGMAMCAIMLFHQSFIYGYLPEGFHIFGHWGVDIFLFLSGIGIAQSLQRNPTRQYFKNRLVRICPTYLTVVFIWTCLTFFGGGQHQYLPFKDYYIYNLFSLWFMVGIILLYLIAPFMYHYITKDNHDSIGTRGWTLIFLAEFSTLLLIFFPQLEGKCIQIFERDILWIFARASAFILGMLFACKKLQLRTIPLSVAIIGLFIAIASKIGYRFLPNVWKEICYQIPQFFALMLALPLLCFLICWLAKRLPHPITHTFSFIGTISLELYLWHEFVYRAISKMFLPSLPPVLLLFMGISISILLAYLTHLVFKCLFPKPQRKALKPSKPLA